MPRRTVGGGATPPEPPQPPAPAAARVTDCAREMGPEPSEGRDRSRHGVGVPFRPGVEPPKGKRRTVLANVDQNG
eukprot:14931436-Alexandrium_andersonii.AAC.1